MMPTADKATEPAFDCPLCPRLVSFRSEWRGQEPSWFNGPVPSFGPTTARLLVVGLAPGLRGANRTGRPFTGDYAGNLLYETLSRHGFASGRYDARPDDGLALVDCRIINAVRCNCRPFLARSIAAMPNLRTIVALGKIAHDSVVIALGGRVSAVPFRHGGKATLGGIAVLGSYHCSRYNTNTGRLTADMFNDVFRSARATLPG
jgi:uracil-DNA glycosylase